MDRSESMDLNFQIPHGYDITKSSEINYCSEGSPFVGKYKDIRALLDYTYHKHYSEERQYLHDNLIDRFLKTRVHDREMNMECEVPLENWIVFTAGPMGAGKGHTIQWLAKNALFPFDAFVNVDPDALRHLLPETPLYNAQDINSAGYLTQKEVNYISEVLSYHSLLHGKNVLVDGSLRNAHWYLKYFQNLREKFPTIKIAILHVTAKPETVLLRARNRAKVTGRHVPEATILESMRSIPESLSVLTPHAEFMATFLNEGNEPEPRLRCCCMQDQVRAGDKQNSKGIAGHDDCSNQGVSGTNDHNNSRCTNDPLMTPRWSVRLQVNSGDNDGTVMTEVDGNDVMSDCSYRPVQGTPHCAIEKHSSNGTTPDCTHLGAAVATEVPTSSSRKRKVDLASPDEVMEMDVCPVQKHPLSVTLPKCSPHAHVQYVLEDQKEGTTMLDSWKEVFSSVWEMRCAIPGAPAIPGITPRTHRKQVLENQRRSSEDSAGGGVV